MTLLKVLTLVGIHMRTLNSNSLTQMTSIRKKLDILDIWSIRVAPNTKLRK